MGRLVRRCAVGAMLIALLVPSLCLAQPRVQNVRAQPTGDFKVEVTYDLQGLGGRTATVRLFYSRDNGRSFHAAQRVEGEVGGNIREGQGHRIVWDPEGEIGAVRDAPFVFKVEAQLMEAPPLVSPPPLPRPPPPPPGEALAFLTTEQDGLTVELLAGAQVVQRGPLSTGSPFQARLKPGAYRLRVTKEEHHPYEKGFELAGGQLFQDKVKLVEAYGLLDLTVLPQDAHIIIDNVPLPRGGATRSVKLREGTHRLEVTAGEKWVPAPPREVRIPDGARKVSLRIELEPRFGVLQLETEPPGAQVTLNGAGVGKTPFRESELLVGRYDVCLALALYDRTCFPVEMVAREEIKRTVKLSPSFGELSLRGSPTGASVFRSGERQPIGSLPAEGLRLPPGSYTLEVRSEPQFDPERVEVEVRKGQPVTREVHLKRRVGRLLVVSDPPTEGATVRIDGKEVGKTPYTSGEMPTGAVEVEVESRDRIGKARAEVEPRGQKVVVVAMGSKLPPPAGKTLRNSIGMEFVLIPAGEFLMGSNGGVSDENPVHTVRLSKPFYLGKYEVMQGQWQAVMGNNPSYFKGDPNLPVEQVSWDDVQEFIRKLNAKEGGTKYRLPTESEWEYVARAGTTTAYSFGDNPRQLGEYAWYYENSGSKTHPVGQKKPNPWGLYDMHGNVWEWVQDRYQDRYSAYTSAVVTDPQGPSSGSGRVARGGSWNCSAHGCRSADRGYVVPGNRHGFLGVRLLRTAE